MSSIVYTPDIFEKECPLLWSLLMKILSCTNPKKIINDNIKYVIDNHTSQLTIRNTKFLDKIFLSFLFNIKKLVKTCITLPIPPTTVYDKNIVNKCITMKIFNVFIIKNWLTPQEFLKSIDIPTQTVYIYTHTVDLRLFPHKSHSRPIHKMADALNYATRLLIAEPTDKIKFVKYDDIYRKGFLSFPNTSENELISVVFHESRRSTHALPLCQLYNWFTTIIDNAIDLHFVNFPFRHPELLVLCPICKDVSNDCTTCKDHSSSCANYKCNKCKCKKSHSHKISISMYHINKIKTLFPEEDHSLLPSYDNKKFIDTLDRLSKTSRYHHQFICSNTECKHATKPYIISLNDYCVQCVKSYKEKKNTTFHKFMCPGCKKEECGLCGKLKIDHKGETLICPKKITRTPEEITNARAEGIRFCPMCDVPTMLTLGCDHITCTLCKEHWCFACERHLPVDSVTGTRYTHTCTGVAVGVVAWARDNTPLPDEFRMIPEINPTGWHDISKKN